MYHSSRARSPCYLCFDLLFQRFFLVFGLIVCFEGGLAAQALFHKPVKVLGDPKFIGTAGNPLLIEGNGPNWVEGRELSSPLGIALDMSASPPAVYIADAGNNRVLGFQYTTQLTAGSYADVIIGQVDRYSNLTAQQNGRSLGLTQPSGLVVDGSGNLYVADTGNNRILRYPKPLSQPGGVATPDMVIGQTSFAGKSANQGGAVSATSLALNASSTFRNGLAIDSSGNLWVADSGNNRLLRFPAATLLTGANNPTADVVLGQADFVSMVAANSRMTKAGLNHPQGLAIDPAGRILVTDAESRVVVFPAAPAVNAQAIRILGIDTAPTSTLTTQIAVDNPFGLTATSAGVVVADTSNNRLLVFPTVDTWSPETTQFSPSATQVVGQSSYTVSKANQGSGDASGMSFNLPIDVAASGSELFAVDFQNNRVLVFNFGAAGVTTPASRVIGQLDFPYFAPNLIEGKEFFLQLTGNLSGSAILDQSSTPPHLYVADTQNNRVLGFNDFTHLLAGQKADLVIGQPDFFRSQVNYPTNDPTMPNQQGLHLPTSLTVDSAGNLYVVDTGNSRVLRFPAPFASGKTGLESADLVIGQTTFTTTVTDPSAQNMSAPIGIALTADAFNASVANTGWLVVSDALLNRVLFFQKPFSSGMSATKVLGSLNFTNTTPGSSDPPRFNAPRGVAVDPSDRVMVADTGNHRVQIFNKAAGINNYDTPPISLTAFNSPLAVSASSGGFWVADIGQNGLLHFPIVSNLVLTNNAPDAAQPANGPLSGFVDSFGNLLIADNDNRVEYFAPALAAINAANGSGRPFTGGSIVSIYPAATTTSSSSNTMPNPIAAGTGAATVIPLPVSLADTQVLVNNTPAPLYFVSPGQINLELSNSLPSSGTADLQIVRLSTGQVYGGIELQLASTDPGLFTSNQSGSGQVAAINVQDGTVNGPTNAVARGQFISLFGTGIGPIANAPPDGQAAAGAVPAADFPQVLIGANATAFVPAADITYSGLAPGLVGVWQTNIMIPSTAPTGSSIPIKIFQNSIPNIDPNSTVTGNTTIAIK